MPNSPLLSLPYLASAQAQKHVTHNEAVSLIDGLLHLSVISRVVATPPGVVVDGDRYLIAASPTGDWLGQAGTVAFRMEGAWRFLTPRKGWRLWVEAENILLAFDGANWLPPAAPTQLQNLTLLGVNAAADVTNKLAVSSSSVLFNHVGAGIQFKVNKNAAANTASLLFQDNFSGRAELGLTGDDNLHFKVSADGSTFSESLVISGTNGLVTAKNNLALDPQSADPTTPTNGQVWYNSTSGKFRARQNGTNIDLVTAASADGDKGDIVVSGSGAVWSLDVAQARGTLSINNIDNTSDVGKPVSSAQASALAAKEPSIAVGTTAQYWRGDKSFVTLDKSAVGLANVDNIADANKPVSSAQASALATKEPTITSGTTAQYWRGDKSFVTLDKIAVGLTNVDNTSDVNKPVSTTQASALALKAPLASPTFIGTPTSTTPSALSNNSTLATTAYADAADLVISALVQAQLQARFFTLN